MDVVIIRICVSLKSSDVYRVGKRAISSVVPKTDLEIQDFKVVNEPILGYLQGSKERTALETALAK